MSSVLGRVKTSTLLQIAGGTLIIGSTFIYFAHKNVQRRVRALPHYRYIFLTCKKGFEDWNTVLSGPSYILSVYLRRRFILLLSAVPSAISHFGVSLFLRWNNNTLLLPNLIHFRTRHICSNDCTDSSRWASSRKYCAKLKPSNFAYHTRLPFLQTLFLFSFQNFAQHSLSWSISSLFFFKSQLILCRCIPFLAVHLFRIWSKARNTGVSFWNSFLHHSLQETQESLIFLLHVFIISATFISFFNMQILPPSLLLFLCFFFAANFSLLVIPSLIPFAESRHVYRSAYPSVFDPWF